MTIHSFDSLFEQQSKNFGQPQSGFDDYRLGGSQFRTQAKEWFPNAVNEGQLHFESPFGQQSQSAIDQHLSQEASIGHIWHHTGHHDYRQNGQIGHHGSQYSDHHIHKAHRHYHSRQSSEQHQGISPQSRDELVKKALEIAGVSATQEHVAAVRKIVDREDSSWDPFKTNYYDSNYRAGHPSTGLMQTIPATFKHYAVPGLTNIHDPLANLVAGIRYAQFDPKYRNRGGLDFVAARNSGY